MSGVGAVRVRRHLEAGFVDDLEVAARDPRDFMADVVVPVVAAGAANKPREPLSVTMVPYVFRAGRMIPSVGFGPAAPPIERRHRPRNLCTIAAPFMNCPRRENGVELAKLPSVLALRVISKSVQPRRLALCRRGSRWCALSKDTPTYHVVTRPTKRSQNPVTASDARDRCRRQLAAP